jgi:hypothetical protein
MKNIYSSILTASIMSAIFLSGCGDSNTKKVDNTLQSPVTNLSNASTSNESPEASSLPIMNSSNNSTPTQSPKKEIDLRAHTVSESPLANGKRIQVDSDDPQLSKSDCLRLSEKYLLSAGKAGKIVVQKPNPKPPWNGKTLPFCINNLDGKGVVFDDLYFR